MPTDKRQRQRGGREARQAALRAAERRRHRQRLIIALGMAAFLVVGLVAVVNPGGGGKKKAASSTSTTLPFVKIAARPPGATVTGDTPCPAPDGSSPLTTKFAKPPPMCINPAKRYAAEIKTSKGPFTMALAAAQSPVTVNNFVVLARYHFYDGVAFHRVVPGFVAQVGDREETGSGNLGYTIPDEPPQGENPYKIWSVAMANTGQPNSGSSQFFVLLADPPSTFGTGYSVLGQVTAGFDVLKELEKAGSPATPDFPLGGKMTQEIPIQSVTITES